MNTIKFPIAYIIGALATMLAVGWPLDFAGVYSATQNFFALMENVVIWINLIDPVNRLIMLGASFAVLQLIATVSWLWKGKEAPWLISTMGWILCCAIATSEVSSAWPEAAAGIVLCVLIVVFCLDQTRTITELKTELKRNFEQDEAIKAKINASSFLDAGVCQILAMPMMTTMLVVMTEATVRHVTMPFLVFSLVCGVICKISLYLDCKAGRKVPDTLRGFGWEECHIKSTKALLNANLTGLPKYIQ